jgi:hypothetical protein
LTIVMSEEVIKADQCDGQKVPSDYVAAGAHFLDVLNSSCSESEL